MVEKRFQVIGLFKLGKKQDNFVEFISPTKDYFRETCKSQNINPIFLNPKFTLYNDVLWCLIETVDLKKWVSLTKFHFYIKRSMEISGKGLLYFHQESSSFISN